MPIINSEKATVSEVNKYIRPIVDQLLNKYNKSTHPDFEKELRELTGIGWKQVKNYRNHPEPTKVISSNSKVLKFIIEERKKDKFYKIKKYLQSVVITFIGALILFILGNAIYKKNSNSETELGVIIDKRLKTILKGQLINCARKSNDTIECDDGVYIKQ